MINMNPPVELIVVACTKRSSFYRNNNINKIEIVCVDAFVSITWEGMIRFQFGFLYIVNEYSLLVFMPEVSQEGHLNICKKVSIAT